MAHIISLINDRKITIIVYERYPNKSICFEIYLLTSHLLNVSLSLHLYLWRHFVKYICAASSVCWWLLFSFQLRFQIGNHIGLLSGFRATEYMTEFYNCLQEFIRSEENSVELSIHINHKSLYVYTYHIWDQTGI